MRKLFLLFTVLFIFVVSKAQLSGIKTIPGDYPTLLDAVTALNTQGVGAGGVTLQLGANQTLAATLQIGSATLSTGINAATQTNPITIDGGNFTINAAFAGTRAGSLSSGANDASIVVNGTDYITIKNCVFTEQASNTTTTTAIENAIGFYNRNSASPFDGVQYATVDNCTFNLSKAATSGSAVFIGSFIWTGTTSLGWAAFGTLPGDMNRYIEVKNSTFTGSYNYITYRGATTANGRALKVTGNTFTNIGGGASTAYGVYGLYLDSLIVNNNTFTFSSAQSTAYYGAFASTNCGGRQEFNGNTVTLSGAITTSTVYGGYYTSIGADRQMNNNIINFGSFPSITTSPIYGLYTTYSGGNNNITSEMNGNTILNQALPSTTGTLYLLYNNFSTGTNTNRKIVMNNNSITNNTKTNSGTVYAIFPGTGDSTIISGNTINNFTWTNNSASGSATFYGIYGNGSPLAQSINNNTVTNITVLGSSTSTGGVIQGIRSSTTGSGTASVFNNTVGDLSFGTGTTTGLVTGIYVSLSTPNNIYKNKVYNLSANQAGGSINAINVASGTTNNVYNNIITGLNTPAATGNNAVIGINVSGGTNANIVYNTIFPSNAASLTSSGSSFGGCGIYVSSTVNTVIQNNIINISGSGITGYFSAIKRSSGTAGVNPTNLTLSNNIYNSTYIYGEGVTESSATNLYYVNGGSFGTADPSFNTSCGIFKTWKGDVGSFYENNLTGSNGVFAPTGSSYAEGAASISTSPSVLDDFNSVTRSLSSPDIGALEFNGTINDASGPGISYTIVPTQNCNLAPTILATITDATGVNTTAGTKPRLYYKKYTEANSFAGNTSGNNGWKYVEATNSSSPFSFTPNYSLLSSSVVASDTIEYFIVAQDIVSTPNVGNNLVSFASGFCPTSVALAGAAFPVSNNRKYYINSTPVVAVKASPISVCANNNDTLSVVLSIAGNVTIGTGTSTSSTYTPYYGSTTAARRIQYLITAAELQSAGLVAGNITDVSFDIASVPTAFTIGDFSLKMGQTTASVLTSTFSSDASVTVYGPTPYSPSVGINTHNLNTPFNWDGTSNIIIEACHGIVGTASLTTVKYVSGLPTGISTYSTNAAGCTQTTGTTTTIRPNVIFKGQSNQTTNYTNFIWNNGITNVGNNNDTIIVQPSFPSGNTMTYSVTASDASGCSFGGNVVVTKNTTSPTGTATADKSNICYGDSIILSASISGGCPPYSYSWSNGSIVVGTAASIKAYPTANTTYTLTVTDNSSQTFSPTNIAVTVNAPVPLSTTPSSRCGTGTVTLSATKNPTDSLVWYNVATGGVPLASGTSFTTPSISNTTNFYAAVYVPQSNSTVTQGLGATTTATYSNPFYSLWSNTHTQHLITAAELRASGLVAGNINSVALDVTSAGTLPMIDLSLKIGTTAATDLTTFVSNAGFVTVYTNASLMPVTGINTLTFNTPYNWDGVSNLVLEFCHGNSGSSATMSRTVKADNTSYISSVKTHVSAATAASTICGDVSTNLLNYTVRPQFIFNGVGKCEGPRTTVTATVVPPPVLTSVANDTICNNASKLLNVVSTLSDFDNYSWSPITGLYTDAAGTMPYTGGNTSSVYVKTTTAATTNYVVTGTNSTGAQCANTDTIVIRIMPNPTISATPAELCVSGTSVLSLTPSTGYATNSLQWQSSSNGTVYNDIANATSATYNTPNLTNTTYYKMVIKDAASTICATAPTKTVNVNNPNIVNTTPGTRCGTGTVNLSATPSNGASVNWYAAASGGTPLLAGNNNFTTPSISATTTYYASASQGGGTANIGPLSPSIGTNASSTIAIGTQQLFFDVLVPTTIQSVNVFPTASIGSSFTIVIQNSSGTEVFNSGSRTTTVTGGTTPQLVTLNAVLAPGTGYRFGFSTNPGMIRNDAGAVYPYTVPGVLSITGNSFNTVYYYFFYDWIITTGCESARTAVVATVDNTPGCGTVPVTLTNFKGEKSTSSNKLSWSTLTEVNNSGFELERSTDGVNYSSIGFIPSASLNGNSSSILNYSFNDAKGFSMNSYYRLKQLDNDGKFSYSTIVLLKVNKVKELTVTSVYPNPASATVKIVIESPVNDKVTLVVTDLTGKVVLQKPKSIAMGNNIAELTINTLSSGSYFVKLVCENGCTTSPIRFVKQ